jgi:two-component system CheB/CheR fusion protein
VGISEQSAHTTPWAERLPVGPADNDVAPRFYRDPALFARLREVVFPRLLQKRDTPLRFWVIGCGTGEDAYALAIELLAFLGDQEVPFRIYATDADRELAAFARAGAYDAHALERVGAATRAEWFFELDGRNRVVERVRRSLVFARHDLTLDPPFGNMDLLLCREGLPGPRPRALSALHYALQPTGFLLVGRGELGDCDGAFRALEGAEGVYVRGTPATPLRLVPRELPQLTLPLGVELAARFEGLPHGAPRGVDDAPTSSQTWATVERAFAQPVMEPPTLRSVVYDIVRSVARVFVPSRLTRAATRAAEPGIVELREHLAEAALAHARTTQRLASVNDKLTTTNEELCASNEELQSLNEELRTAQEQLLSSNDELGELNEQLSRRNRELTQLSSDLANVFDSARMPVVLLDEACRIRRFSSQAHQLLSLRASDVGRPLEDLRLHIEVPDLGAQLARVIATGISFEREVRDRAGRWHRLAIRAYRSPRHHIEGAAISLFDIDDLKQSARRAELASEQAERANRTKDEFLAALSHELRSPLHGVLIYAQLLRRDAVRGEKVKQATEAIEAGVLALVEQLDQLLDVSRIVSGKFALRTQTVDLVGVVEHALALATESFAAKQLRVRTELPAALPICGDALRLQQVAVNLLSNAVKFTRDGGSISLTLSQRGESVELCVRDDGVGIAPEFLPSVFDRFTQGDSSYTREFGGLGLGLNIVRQIVELHGGQVSVASEGPGLGAQFTVMLPVARALAREPAAELPRPSNPRALESVRILLVDDDCIARAAVSDALSHAGAEVLCAPSAADALEVMRECAPQLMLCDIAMPGEDGYALIRRVRALGESTLAHIPALALTAFARAGDRERALAEGYQEHLAKPVDVDVLIQSLTALRGDSSAS